MRRAQSVRHRPSLAVGADDLGILKEGDERNEDVLRRQLLDKDRENDKLQTQVQALQAQLAARPSLERVQELEKEYKNLDLILQGTQRENERCMAELDRAKVREKMLERELQKLVGENWQASLELTPAPIVPSRSLFASRHATPMSGNSSYLTASSLTPNSPENPMADSSTTQKEHKQNVEAQVAHIENVRMLILGMEQRLESREQKLQKTLERAEGESRKYEKISATVNGQS